MRDLDKGNISSSLTRIINVQNPTGSRLINASESNYNKENISGWWGKNELKEPRHTDTESLEMLWA